MNTKRAWRTNGVLMPFRNEKTRVQLRVDYGYVEDLGDDFYRYEETLPFEPSPIVVDGEIVWCSLPWSTSKVFSEDALDFVVERMARDPKARMDKSWREALVELDGYLGTEDCVIRWWRWQKEVMK